MTLYPPSASSPHQTHLVLRQAAPKPATATAATPTTPKQTHDGQGPNPRTAPQAKAAATPTPKTPAAHPQTTTAGKLAQIRNHLGLAGPLSAWGRQEAQVLAKLALAGAGLCVLGYAFYRTIAFAAAQPATQPTPTPRKYPPWGADSPEWCRTPWPASCAKRINSASDLRCWSRRGDWVAPDRLKSMNAAMFAGDDQGCNALHLAVAHGRSTFRKVMKESWRALTPSHNPANWVTDNGHTPLHIAVNSGRANNLVSLLDTAKACPTVVNSDDQTPLQLAKALLAQAPDSERHARKHVLRYLSHALSDMSAETIKERCSGVANYRA